MCPVKVRKTCNFVHVWLSILLIKILYHHLTKVLVIFQRIYLKVHINLYIDVCLYLGKAHQDDQRLHNLFYRKSKLESVNETSALLSGFAIVSFERKISFYSS
jgi:hypothetical protein